MIRHHHEKHLVQRIGWLRAAVLGANDGILSTASLIVGVASAHSARDTVLLTGVAGLVAGAMSMGAGEYVSVSSQADTENADRSREMKELEEEPESERRELAAIYRSRGVDTETALKVADQLMAHDALGAHMRDELGIHEAMVARPVQAAMTSAASFAAGAIVPVLTVLVLPGARLALAVTIASLLLLAILGGLGARTRGGTGGRGGRPRDLSGALGRVA